MIFGASILLPWNGKRYKQQAIFLRIGPIPPWIMINRTIELSCLEEVDPIKLDTIPSIYSIGKVKNGLKLLPKQINLPLGKGHTILHNYFMITSSFSEGKVLEIYRIYGYSTSKIYNGLKFLFPNNQLDPVQDGFILQL